MKNFNLFLAFVVCSSVAMATTEVTEVAETSLVGDVVNKVKRFVAPAADAAAAQVAADAAAAQAAIDAKLSTKVYNYTVKPVVKAATAVNGYVAQADAEIITVTNSAIDNVSTLVKPATDKIGTVVNPTTNKASNFVKSVTGKVSVVSQETYAQLSAFVQRPAAMILTAAAVSAAYYAYTQYNEDAKN